MNRMEHIARGFVLLVIIGALFGSQASAQPIKAPYVITSPGVYELSEDARTLTDTYGIKIESSNVVIDGGDHFLGGDNGDKSVGVYVNLYGGSITNVTVKNFLLEDWETGVGFNYVKGQEGDSNLISRCNVVKCGTAIHVQYSDYVTVDDNTISDCSTGIVVDDHSTFSKIGNNEMRRVGLGMSVTQSTQIDIAENNINTCEVYGLEVLDSDSISITKNAISDNKYAAFRIENSKNLDVTGNNFSKTTTGPVLVIGNEVHEAVITNNWFGSYEDVSVDDVSSGIVWNSTLTPGTNILGGPYLGGNYWGSAPGEKGFSDKTPDTDGFGISDKPYQINNNNVDYLPLTHTTATKAPEEQADNQTVEAVAEQGTDADLMNQTSPVNVTAVPETSTPAASLVPVNENVNQSNVTPGAQTTPDTNASIMNRSMTNAFPSVTFENPQSESGMASGSEPAGSDRMRSLNGTDTTQMLAQGENQTIGAEVTGQKNTTSPASVGYLVFTSSEPNPRIILTTTRGTEVTLDPFEGNNLTVPVPVEGMIYSRYRIEKDGFTPATGNISPYPGSGQVITIQVPLIRSANSINTQINQSGQVSLSPVPAQILNTQINNASQIQGSVNRSGEQETTHQNISVPTPVISNNIQPMVMTNGLVQEKSQKSHMITATAGPGGAIFPQGDVRIPDGGSIAFIVDPYEGRRVAYLVIDGVQTSPMSEYRFINVTSDHIIVGGFS